MAKTYKSIQAFGDALQGALDNALAEHLSVTQGKLAKANPKDTGRMASSWFISQNKPRTDTRPEEWAEPGSQRVEVEPYSGKIEFDGSWYIANNLPYAERVALDPLYAKGGAGGAAWFRSIDTQQPADLNKRFQKFFRRVG